ncbi:MAG: arsenate reductase (glutaredoxin) [Gammaproteobacteria bacterium]|jgi:arsenate reductase
MENIRIYHNPRCSKSRQALLLLRDRGIEPTIVEYLKQPLAAAEIKRLLKLLQLSPRELMRKKEAQYRALNLADPKLGADTLIKAMVEHPVLIERPIVVAGERAVVGRPPEKVLDIL